MAEKELFTIDMKGAFDAVFLRHGGSAGKAVLEAVQNSIDQDATRIDIGLSGTRIIISDDGAGFTSRQSISDNFGKVCKPHEKDADGHSTDAVFGQFGLGRGQCYAIGVNVWETNNWRLRVDVREAFETDSIAFEVEEMGTARPGCHILIDLYKPLNQWEQRSTVRELKELCALMTTQVWVNGEMINRDPETVDWTYESTDFRVKRSDASSGELVVYQMGAKVCTYPISDFGFAGIVLSHRKLMVNSARNAIQANCDRWKQIKVKLREMGADALLRRNRRLTGDERTAVIEQLLSGELPWYDARSVKLFHDAAGNAFSYSAITSRAGRGSSWAKAPDGRLKIGYAVARDIKACKAIKDQRGLVFSHETVEAFETDTGGFITDVLQRFDRRIDEKLAVTEIADMFQSDLREGVTMAEELTLTPTQKNVLTVLNGLAWQLGQSAANIGKDHGSHVRGANRVIRWGDSDVYDAWTDGETFIAISRRLCKPTRGFPFWAEMVELLIRQYCFNDPNYMAQQHMNETAMAAYQHLMTHNFTNAVNDGVRRLLNLYERRKMRLPDRVHVSVVKILEARIATELLEMAQDDPEALIAEAEAISAATPLAT